jgi:hypothetical protein
MKINQTIHLFGHPDSPWVIQRNHSWSSEGSLPDHVAQSLILICPHCLKTWAILEIEGDPLFDARMVPCHNHPPVEPFAPVPGSILTEEGIGRIDIELLAVLPPELLEREFHLHFSQEQASHATKSAIPPSRSNSKFTQLCSPRS